MSQAPGPESPPRAPADDGQAEAQWLQQVLQRQLQRPLLPARQRTQALFALGLAAVVLVLAWLLGLAHERWLGLQWQRPGAGPGAWVVDAPGVGDALHRWHGLSVEALQPLAEDGQPLSAPVALGELHQRHSLRWVVSAAQRQQRAEAQEVIGQALKAPRLRLWLQGSTQPTLELRPGPRGLGHLGAVTVLSAALALAMLIVAALQSLGASQPAGLRYALILLPQAALTLLVGMDALPGLGSLERGVRWELPLRLLLETLAVVALAHALAHHPVARPGLQRWPRWMWLPLAWPVAQLLRGAPLGPWWLDSAVVLGSAAAAAALPHRLLQRQFHPLMLVMHRLVLSGTVVYGLLTLAVAAAAASGRGEHAVAALGPALWLLAIDSALMLTPSLSHSRPLAREAMMMAGIAAVFLFVAVLAAALLNVGPWGAMALALGVTVLLYRAMRRWLVQRIAGTGPPSAERMFDRLYRAARTVELAPERLPEQFTLLLKEVFEPLDLAHTPQRFSRVWVAEDGASLLVPLPRLDSPAEADAQTPAPQGAVVLRYAGRGARLFNDDDRRLALRLTQQLCQAVAYDRAVERGRREERSRIAQDLHDDIGARLLTLMYQAPTREMEAYARHTLQDLKTLTRGLAAPQLRLSHAVAEWKSDITQRLDSAGLALQWRFDFDRDRDLTVVQWSALTRILREWVSNILAHAGATEVSVQATLGAGELRLTVRDNGHGRDPAAWAPGLGLGGVRKRARLLGAEVSWHALPGHGIRCELRCPLGEEPTSPPAP